MIFVPYGWLGQKARAELLYRQARLGDISYPIWWGAMWLSVWRCSARTDSSNVLNLQLGQRRPIGTYYTVAPVQMTDGSKVTSCV